MSVRNSDPVTSDEAAASSVELARKLRDRILQLARVARFTGITIAESVEAIPEHKPSSVTPRFSELVERGQLVRSFIGMGKPNKCFPAGRPLYRTRTDGQTKKRVLIHWLPEFAPSPNGSEPGDQATLIAEDDRIQGELEHALCDGLSELA